jgi:lipopolysaccharide export system protein LptC
MSIRGEAQQPRRRAATGPRRRGRPIFGKVLRDVWRDRSYVLRGLGSLRSRWTIDLSTDATQTAPMERRRRRLVWVKFLRRTLPVAAVAILVGVVGQVAWRSLQASAATAPVVTESAARMVNPQFTGSGRDGSRYLVTAQSGVRDVKDNARILLSKPTVTVTRADATSTHTVSERGVFREDNQSLTLDGDVRVEEAGGFHFVANNAVIDTGTGQVVGGKVQGQGPTGAVQSGSYAVSDKGDRMVFKGGVRTQLKGR